MTVLNDILEWSQKDSRPKWQRDALRRLVEKGALTEEDLSELTEICKSVHELSEPRNATSLSKDHIPKSGVGLPKVVLTSIFHERGVNALAEKQTLDFNPEGLTVVYGANAAGKTGYTRILKTACRSRGAEKILSNIFASEPHTSPEVAIRYRVGDNPEQEWSGNEDDNISRISVFDAKSASVYLNEETVVAFRPLGLDLFDKLVQACNGVKSKLSEEQSGFASKDRLSVVQTEVPEGTDVVKRLSEVDVCTKPEEFEKLVSSFKELASISLEEETQLASLEKTAQALKANDPVRIAEYRAQRFRKLAQQLQVAEDKLSDDAISALYSFRTKLLQKEEEAKNLRGKMFSAGYLIGTGLEKWRELWEVARKFSEESAYPDQEFPVVEDGAQCVLCQQQLDHDAGQRFAQFQEFVESRVETELQELRKKIGNLETELSQVEIIINKAKEISEELHIENKDTGTAVLAALEENEKRCEAVSASLNDKSDTRPPSDLPKLVAVADKVENLAQRLDERIGVLRSNKAIKEEKEREFRELHARKTLQSHLSKVLDEIERAKKFATYEKCLQDTNTHAITRKNTEITEKAVTEHFKENFQRELEKLYSIRMKVEIKKTGGREGVLYHKLILSDASNPKTRLQQVASEGEQRYLSVAAFLAELSIADDRSGIVFDDPVSSLDDKRRRRVAQRLVAEAQKRQVIVFTHDIVFLCWLKDEAKKKKVVQHNRCVKAGSASVGICDKVLPWDILTVQDRINWLTKQSEAVAELYEKGDQSGYEEKASYTYGKLREAWERAVEGVLLEGVVERFRTNVQTQQILELAEITRCECEEAVAAMSECSQWFSGHDTAPAAGAGYPNPADLNNGINALKIWVGGINKRRDKKRKAGKEASKQEILN